MRKRTRRIALVLGTVTALAVAVAVVAALRDQGPSDLRSDCVFLEAHRVEDWATLIPRDFPALFEADARCGEKVGQSRRIESGSFVVTPKATLQESLVRILRRRFHGQHVFVNVDERFHRVLVIVYEHDIERLCFRGGNGRFRSVSAVVTAADYDVAEKDMSLLVGSTAAIRYLKDPPRCLVFPHSGTSEDLAAQEDIQSVEEAVVAALREALSRPPFQDDESEPEPETGIAQERPSRDRPGPSRGADERERGSRADTTRVVGDAGAESGIEAVVVTGDDGGQPGQEPRTAGDEPEVGREAPVSCDELDRVAREAVSEAVRTRVASCADQLGMVVLVQTNVRLVCTIREIERSLGCAVVGSPLGGTQAADCVTRRLAAVVHRFPIADSECNERVFSVDVNVETTLGGH